MQSKNNLLDDPSTDGNAQEDSGEEAQPDGSISSDVVDEADQSQSGESKEDQATQEDQASTENAGIFLQFKYNLK